MIFHSYLCIYFCGIIHILFWFDINIFGRGYLVYFSGILTGITLIILHYIHLSLYFSFFW